MSKPPIVVEIPGGSNEQVARLQLEEVQKIVRQARLGRKDRITVTIKQGE